MADSSSEDERLVAGTSLRNELELKCTEPSIFDPRDEVTADNWVKRNPAMIRLTGKHPFNSEPPLTRLMRHGFITPAQIHYVRNHGPVAKAQWDSWTVEVSGLVERPRLFTMDQLVTEFRSLEFPVTLVCAGNRRKEQNMVKQSIGFNWGPSAAATSLWRGVRLRDVLKRCGILSRQMGALHVCFEGAENLPGGGSGSKYGTSIRREVALDASRDIILAYMQNGERLLPDHGFPVRMIIPGYIGGRMVKWLTKITVTTEESKNYYHWKDNRLLPGHVDSDREDFEDCWYNSEYIITDVNTNSVIATPRHDEILPITCENTWPSYTLRGYAYSGAGKKVTRVEVTRDNGDTWQTCSVDHPEKHNKYGKYWCWCFWSVQVDVIDLLGCKGIAVRAWDETLNTQPEKLNWNVMGMMNNCWFRVKIKPCRTKNGEIALAFEHPIQAGNLPGGWMVSKAKQEEQAPFMMKKRASKTTYLMWEVNRHNTDESAWIVVHGHVYDCTSFLKDHPGGAESILINAGSDSTEEFEAIHSEKAKIMLEDYWIGELIDINSGSADSNNSTHFADHESNSTGFINTRIKEGTTPALEDYRIGELIDINSSNSTHLADHESNSTGFIRIKEGITIDRSRTPPALKPGEKIQCKLVSKTSITHNTRLFRFALPSPDQVLGLPVGKHIFVYATINDNLCTRKYTPTSAIDELGHFDLLIKIYFKDSHPKFPHGGLMSQYLDSLPLGSTLDVKGPFGQIEYIGRGTFVDRGKYKFARKLAMVAGGTGITPIYRVIQAVFRDPEDETEMYLVFANRTEDDILLREELDEWAERDERLNVWYVVGEALRKPWKCSVGLITEGVLREHVPQGSSETLAMACGPPSMIQFAVTPNLEKMEYDVKNSLLVF